MTTSSLLDVQRPSPFVARVFLNRPEVRNAFNDTTIAELTQVFTELSADTQLRAIVLGGHGKAFCAGADLSWMRAMADFDWEQNRADAQALADMLWAVWRCPVPVVGRVHGDCYAGGVGLAAVCDVLVAADGVNFCLSEAKLGLLPGTISPYVIRAMGEQASRRYFVTAERFSAAQAQAHGLRARAVRARRARREGRRDRRRAGRQRPDGRARLQEAGAGRGRPAARRRPCAPRPRAASPTSAPATKAAKACRVS